MTETSSDPTVIRAVAAHAEDVISAYEVTVRSSKHAALRVTPPFHAYMRARLHVLTPDAPSADSGTIVIDPRSLVDREELPPYPTVNGTKREITRDPDLTYSVDLHHEWHTRQVNVWRRSAKRAIVDAVNLDLPEGPHRVQVKVLDIDR